MSVESLSLIAGMVLQLALAWIPGVKKWYEGQSSEGKAGVMLVSLLIVSVGVFALACTGLATEFEVNVACAKADAIGLVKVFLTALVANQSVYVVGVKPFKAKKA